MTLSNSLCFYHKTRLFDHSPRLRSPFCCSTNNSKRLTRDIRTPTDPLSTTGSQLREWK